MNLINEKIKHNSIYSEDITVLIKTIIYGIQIVLSLVYLLLAAFSLSGGISLNEVFKILILVGAALFLYRKDRIKGLYIVAFPFVIQSVFMDNNVAYYIAILMILMGLAGYARDYLKNKLTKTACYIAMVLAAVVAIFNCKVDGIPITVGSGLMNNYAIEHFESDYYFWPSELREALPYENIPEMAHNRSFALKTVYEISDKDLSKYNENAFKIAMASISNRKKDTAMALMENVVDYGLAPLTFLENCDGYGESITADRLDSLLICDPWLVMIYVKISIVLLMVLFSIGISNVIRSLISKKGTIIIPKILVCMAWILACALLSVTAFDYMLFIPVLILLI